MRGHLSGKLLVGPRLPFGPCSWLGGALPSRVLDPVCWGSPQRGPLPGSGRVAPVQPGSLLPEGWLCDQQHGPWGGGVSQHRASMPVQGIPGFLGGAFGFLLVVDDKEQIHRPKQLTGFRVLHHEWGGGLALGGSAPVMPPGQSTTHFCFKVRLVMV